MGWIVTKPQYVGCGVSLRHVIPLDDLGEHQVSVYCSCQPTCDHGDETVIVHNSFDGRERFETGERRKS